MCLCMCVFVVLDDCFRFFHALARPYAIRSSSTIYIHTRIHTHAHTHAHVLIVRSERPTQAPLTTRSTRKPTTRQF